MGPTLDLLMVRPGFRRRGVADALVGMAVEELRAQGTSGILRSAHCVSNEESTAWHRAFGFEEELDLFLARLRRTYYAHEVSRYEASADGAGTLPGGERDADTLMHLRSLHEFWSRRAEELEEVAEREGFEAVMPALRLHP